MENSIKDKRRENENLNSRLNDKNREVRNLESRLNDKNQENRRLQSSLDVHKNRERNEEEEEKSRDHYIYESKLSSWMDTEVFKDELKMLNLCKIDEIIRNDEFQFGKKKILLE